MLTNDRIDKLIRITNETAINIMSNKPDAIRAMEYFAVTWELYNQTFFFYDDYNINQEISKRLQSIFQQSLPIWFNIWSQGKSEPEIIKKLVGNMIIARHFMNRGMQNLKYFVRIGTSEIKGLNAALKMFGIEENELARV